MPIPALAAMSKDSSTALSNRETKRRDQYAWYSYDWADSGYTTILITIFAVFIQNTIFKGEETAGAVVWAWSFALSMLVGALLSPFLGSLADAYQSKRMGLAFSALVGGTSCIVMGLLPVENSWLIVTCLVFANLGHELSLTFYNGFLPEVADEAQINNVSAKGLAVGYFGGGLALLLAMVFLFWSPYSSSFNLRVCIVGTGLWWLLFTIPTIYILRDRGQPCETSGVLETCLTSFRQTIGTFRAFKKSPTLFWFLIAFLIYNDGIQTVNTQAPTFALQELSFTEQGLAAVILMIQFVATPGALVVGWIANRWGRKKTLVVCLAVWVLLLVSAWFVREKWQFWMLAVGVALVLGGTQSISRAIMGTLTPQGQEARYFGFFNLSGKATCFLGTLFFGSVVALTGSSRLAIVGLVLFFVVGLVLVATRLNIQSADHTD